MTNRAQYTPILGVLLVNYSVSSSSSSSSSSRSSSGSGGGRGSGSGSGGGSGSGSGSGSCSGSGIFAQKKTVTSKIQNRRLLEKQTIKS